MQNWWGKGAGFMVFQATDKLNINAFHRRLQRYADAEDIGTNNTTYICPISTWDGKVAFSLPARWTRPAPGGMIMPSIDPPGIDLPDAE
jgi:hypothetical protein